MNSGLSSFFTQTLAVDCARHAAWKKEFTSIQDIFAKIINTEVASESGLFYGGEDSPEVHDSRTKAAATQLIKHARSQNEVCVITICS